MIGKTGKKERLSIKVEFVECCSHSNDCVGLGNIVNLYGALSVVDEVTAKRRQAKRCASIPYQRTVFRGYAAFATVAFIGRIVDPEEIVAMNGAARKVSPRVEQKSCSTSSGTQPWLA